MPKLAKKTQLTTDDKVPPIDQSLYAAIDLGSNSFHMIIAREAHGQMQIIDKHKEMVRLRSGLGKNGCLTDKSFQQGIECLERFGQRIKGINTQNVRSVGTNTLRNASNSHEFLKRAKWALGHSIKIISGQEEARLIYLGVAHGLATSDEQRLVMDIGGGSTEYIIGQHFENSHLTSTEMGCVSISQKFFLKGKITEERMNSAISKCRQILRPHRNKLKELGWDTTIGASGSIKSISQILEINKWSPSGITLEGMQKLSKVLIKAGSTQQIKVEGLKDERKPVLVGGLAILMATFIELKIECMQVSANALREGLIFDTLGRLYDKDVRETSVKAMQKWMNVDTQQARQITKTAQELYKQAYNTWQLCSPDNDFKHLLKWACMLHECGIAISYKRYCHHSAYLIAQADMAGFDQQDKFILSTLVLNHRGKFNESIYGDLDKSLIKQITYLTVILRLAVRIHRGRGLLSTDPRLYIEGKKHIHLKCGEKWLKNHPLTCLDLEIEAKQLNAIGLKLTLE